MTVSRGKGIAPCVAAVSMLVVAACASSKNTSTPATTAASNKPAYAATLEPTINQVMKANAIPGAVVLVRSPSLGDWTATFGTRVIGKDDPIRVDDHFRIGSNTKTMTSTVILQLVQEGKLKLDDPVSKYVPGVPNGDQITISQLSDMRSGLYSYSFDPGFNETLDREPQKVWKPEEMLAIAFSHPVDFAPGAQFEYSNTNIVLLGVIIEKLTAMSASEAFKKRIFEPLGMKNTLLPLQSDASIPDPHPQGYSFGTNVSTIDTYALPAAEQPAAVAGTLKPNNETDANPSWGWTAGGAISTADDLSVYVKKLVGGGLLDEQTQKLRLESFVPIDPGKPGGYGLGIAEFGPLIGHDGQIPGFMTFMGHDPKTDLTVVILTNLATVPSGEGSALTLLKAILPTLYPGLAIPGGDAAAKVGHEDEANGPPAPSPGG